MRKPTRSREVGRGETRPAGRLAPAAAAAVARRARTATRGRWPPATGSCSSTPACTSRARWRHLERALDQAGLQIEDVRLIVCTHAHVDHCGQAPTIAERAGCEVWMHPNHAHHTASAGDLEQTLERRVEIAPPERRARGAAAALDRAAPRPGDRPGGHPAGRSRADRRASTVDTDLGAWQVVETPGHAPSHICLYQPERRLLISGDHLLGRVSLYFDVGYTPDPVGEFLASLDKVEGARRAARAVRPRPPVHRRARAHRPPTARWSRERLDAPSEAALARRSATAYELAQEVYGELLQRARRPTGC